jgi:undecaprenyl-diphosphatase
MDNYIAHLVHSLPQTWQPAMVLFTTLGSTQVIIAVVVAWACIELMLKKPWRALYIALSLSAVPLYVVIKTLVHRHRPMSTFVTEFGLKDYSFPSGHATASMAVYITLAYLLARRLPKPWSTASTAALALLVFFVGLSRVYLGVHYPTDVLGGWLLGALVVIGLHKLLSKRLA